MSLFEDTNPRELKELLGQIHTREAALPDFQRDFVWDPNATQELILSIMLNYPAGSLLRIRNTHNLFANREFQGAPELNGHHPTYLVLDGQQRLTSLYQAFYGVGDHRYFLNVGNLRSGGDVEECVFHARANSKLAVHLTNLDRQAKDLILPLSVLKGGSGEFVHWILKVAQLAARGEEQLELHQDLLALHKQWIETVDDYRFPVVTLSDSTGAEAVCTIFETLNRTGVKLSAFELLTARFWPQRINLRSLRDKALAEYPIIADFGVDPYYLLQVVALIARSTPSCKRGDVLDLKADAIERWWDRAVAGVAEGLAILRDDCGVIIPKWLPYNTIIAPLGAVLARTPLGGGPEAGGRRQKIVRWFWCSVFGQSYEFASNSQSAKDVIEMTEWLAGGQPPESVRSLRFDPLILRDTTPRQRAIYRGTIALILRRGPRDFHTGAKITGDLIVENRIDDHHIFPTGYLSPLKVPGRLRDCVVNRTLIDRPTNIRISDRAPSDYLEDVERELKSENFGELLRSHLLPTGERSPLWRDDFDSFLDWRQDALWQEIRQVTGIQEATDLLSDGSSEAG